MCEESLEKGEKLICWHCHYHLPLANYHKLAESPLVRRFAGKVPVQYAWAYLKFTKEGKVQHLLHQLKYNNKPEIGDLMGQCKEAGVSNEQIFEVFAIANIIGGTIVIPHLRRAVEYWEALNETRDA